MGKASNLVTITARHDWQLFAIAIIAAGLAFTNPNAAMIVALLGIPSGLIALYRRLRSPQSRAWLRALATYSGCALLVVSGPIGLGLAENRVAVAVKPLMEQLDKYREGTHQYPASLVQLGLARIPKCPGNPMPVMYHLKERGYTLTCITFGFNHHTYESWTGKWRNWD